MSGLTGAGYQPDGEGAQQSVQSDDQSGGDQKETVQNTDGNEGQPSEGGEQVNDNQGNPLTALVQSRQQNRDTAAHYEAQIASLRQEIDSLKGKGDPEPKPWTNPYNAEEHPVDHLRAELEHTRAEFNQLKEDGTRRLTDAENAQALNEFEASVTQEIQMATQTTPELLPAYQFVHHNVSKMHQGQGLTGKRLAQAVRNTMLQAFVNGQTNGASAPETVAQMALGMGFQAKPASPKADPVVRGQKAAPQSLGQATGTGGDTTLPSAQQLSAMSKSDLTANNRAGLNRIKQILQGKVPIE